MGSSCCTITYYIKEPLQKNKSFLESSNKEINNIEKNEECQNAEGKKLESPVENIHPQTVINNFHDASIKSLSIRSPNSSEASNKGYYHESKLFSELELIIEKQGNDKRLPDIFKSIVKDSQMINVITSSERSSVELFGYLKNQGKLAQKKTQLNYASSKEFSSDELFDYKEEFPP